MSRTTDDTATIEFLHPLQKRTRTAAVTAQLEELRSLNRNVVLRRVTEPAPAQRLAWETLVAVARGFERAGDTEAADRVLVYIIQRVGGTVKNTIARWAGLTAEDRTDAAQQMIGHLCEEVKTLTPGAEFWECNFTTALTRRLITVWHAGYRKQIPTVSLVQENADGVSYDALAEIPDTHDMFAEIEVDALVQRLSRRHPKMAEAVFLRMSNYSDEEIAGRLGVTSRTLRNWMAQARTLWESEIYP